MKIETILSSPSEGRNLCVKFLKCLRNGLYTINFDDKTILNEKNDIVGVIITDKYIIKAINLYRKAAYNLLNV